MRQNIRRQREGATPPNPLRREDIPELPRDYTETNRGDRFLLYDSGEGGENRIIIFATNEGIQLLGTNAHWFMPGSLFSDLHHPRTIKPAGVSLCFALLPNKTEATNQRFIREVLNSVRNVGVDPEDNLIDFERAAMNTIRNQLNLTELFGCYFHLCSNIWKHVQELGYQIRYMAEEEFATGIRMLAALAFVPPDDVIESFEVLIINIRNNLDDLVIYFEDNYIGRFLQNAPRRQATFPIEIWNMYHRTDLDLPRTNNSVEGWHHRFQCHVMACHPSFWKFIDVLKREEGIIRAGVLQNQGGHPPPPPRRRYADVNARIIRIVDDYPNRERINYLRSISHNINYIH